MSTVEELNFYPIKSCRGLSLKEAKVDELGIPFDRHWMVVSEKGEFLTQRGHPKLALVETALQENHLRVSAPGMSPLEVPVEGATEGTVATEVWGSPVEVYVYKKAMGEWFSQYLEEPCQLVRVGDISKRTVEADYSQGLGRVNLADGFPFLILSKASLDLLNSKLDQPLPMNRFRPNIVVGGVEAHAEDEWKKIKIGDVIFHISKGCTRCILTCVDQATAERGSEPLKTLATYRKFDGKIRFGQNSCHENVGTIRVGDAVEILE